MWFTFRIITIYTITKIKRWNGFEITEMYLMYNNSFDVLENSLNMIKQTFFGLLKDKWFLKNSNRIARPFSWHLLQVKNCLVNGNIFLFDFSNCSRLTKILQLILGPTMKLFHHKLSELRMILLRVPYCYRSKVEHQMVLIKIYA